MPASQKAQPPVGAGFAVGSSNFVALTAMSSIRRRGWITATDSRMVLLHREDAQVSHVLDILWCFLF